MESGTGTNRPLHISELGWSRAYAWYVRQSFGAFADGWDDPEMDIYNSIGEDEDMTNVTMLKLINALSSMIGLVNYLDEMDSWFLSEDNDPEQKGHKALAEATRILDEARSEM